jgi:hypothetical protein
MLNDISSLLCRFIIAAGFLFMSCTLQCQQLPAVSDAAADARASIVQIIKKAQAAKVRESWGENPNQCFTDIDLKAFHRDNVPKIIAENLRQDARFLKLVASMKNLSAVQVQDVLDTGAKTYKPTWAQIGRIDRQGQTDAGQTAEREIAEAIVRAVKEVSVTR